MSQIEGRQSLRGGEVRQPIAWQNVCQKLHEYEKCPPSLGSVNGNFDPIL